MLAGNKASVLWDWCGGGLGNPSGRCEDSIRNGTLEEKVYMRPAPGFYSGGPNSVCLLVKSLHGLRQPPCQWHMELCTTFQEIGFVPCQGDPGLFKREAPGHTPVCVEDEMLVGEQGWGSGSRNQVPPEGAFQYPRSGCGQVFYGLLIERDRQARTIRISAPLKIAELLVKFGQDTTHLAPTPMTTDFMVTKRHEAMEEDDPPGAGKLLEPGHEYPKLIGSLQYLASNERPEIFQAVGVLSRYREKPTTAHWNAVMRVLRYLKGTMNRGIMFGGEVHASREFLMWL